MLSAVMRLKTVLRYEFLLKHFNPKIFVMLRSL